MYFAAPSSEDPASTRATQAHCPAVSTCLNRRIERKTVKNFRVVVITDRVKVPKVIIALKMKICPIALAKPYSMMCVSLEGLARR